MNNVNKTNVNKQGEQRCGTFGKTDPDNVVVRQLLFFYQDVHLGCVRAWVDLGSSGHSTDLLALTDCIRLSLDLCFSRSSGPMVETAPGALRGAPGQCR